MPADFGYHNDEYLVSLCTICAKLWHWTPNQTLAQPESMVLDMIARINLEDAVERAREKGMCITPEDVREWLQAYTDPDPVQQIDYEAKPIRIQ